MRRVVIPELLDNDSGSPREVADSLADLRWLNRYFGGWSTTADLLLRVAKHANLTQASYLDVAGASGDTAHFLQTSMPASDVTFQVTVMDKQPSHLKADSASSISGDAFALPFSDKSYDFVGCSLFIHHLEPAEIRTFLLEAARVARHAVIINDLRRSWFHWLVASLGSPLYRSRITRHDAPASVRRAYTLKELRGILQQVPEISFEISKHFFYRLGVVIKLGVQ